MKRWILLLALLCALLTACGTGETTEPTDVTGPSAVTESLETEPTEPHLLVSQHGGVSVYELDGDICAGFFPWGEDRYALLTTAGEMYLLSGQELKVEKTRDLECSLSPSDPSILVSGEKLAYFDTVRDAYVTLGKNLTELSAISIRDAVIAGPLMNEDFTAIYYATADGIRALDMSTGNSRLLRQEHQTVTELKGLDFEGTNLHYKRMLSNGVEQDCFIRTDDGTLVEVATINGDLETWETNYAAVMEFHLPLTYYRQVVCGSLDSESGPVVLTTDLEPDVAFFTGNGTVLLQKQLNPGLMVELYDLETGDLLAGYSRTSWAQPFSSGCYDGKTLWLWDGASSQILGLDMGIFQRKEGGFEKLYTLEDPASLDTATAMAQAIADQHGVGIELSSAENRTSGVNYGSWPDYRPQEYAAALKTLSEIMAQFPNGLFQQLKMDIRLVDEYDPAQTLPKGSGELIIDSRRVMVLSICDDMEQIFYHELFHAMELYITGETNRLSKWTELNPEDFSYAGSTIPYESGELAESEYLYAVADDYGLVSAREDRAQVFLYAMLPGNEELFQNEVLQAKLQYLSTAIRYAWNWRKMDTVFPWEQYLATEE